MQKLSEKSQQEGSGITFNCDRCKDTGSVLLKVTEAGLNGKERTKELFRPCDCMEKKHLQNRFKNALIPDEFVNAKLKTYRTENETQKFMHEKISLYLKDLQALIDERKKANSFGFLAVVGESELYKLSGQDRKEARKIHNNFGLGKTHLQMAAAKWIMNNIRLRDQLADGNYSATTRGCRVLCVSDTTFMQDLINAKRGQDDSQEFYKLLDNVNRADVLVWDDLGKSKWTETKEELYYQVINSRYQANKPILFSSNEDPETLEDKIGFAAADRLLNGMCKGRLYEVEGESFRGQEDE